jgi:uncharacterized protein YndB with AHSA1/START domain
MLDRLKLETILANRFPGSEIAQRAAAANAIMALAGNRSEERARTRPERRLLRAPASTTVSVLTRINAPLERVFDLFTDIEHAKEHVSAIVDVEMLTVGPFALGTRWRESRRVVGRVDAAEMEVTAFERYRAYTITHHKGGIRIDTVFEFESAGDATQVTIEFGLGGAGLPPGLLTPVSWAIAGKVRRTLERDVADLKNQLEAAAM